VVIIAKMVMLCNHGLCVYHIDMEDKIMRLRPAIERATSVFDSERLDAVIDHIADRALAQLDQVLRYPYPSLADGEPIVESQVRGQDAQ
jgi:hypothetical protein